MEIINCGEGMHNMEDGYCLDCGLTVDQIDAWDELQAERDALARDLGEWLSLARRQYKEMPHNEPLCPMLSGINKTEELLGLKATRKEIET